MNEELLHAKINHLIAKNNLLIGFMVLAISADIGVKDSKILRDYEKLIKANLKIDNMFEDSIQKIVGKES